MRFLDAVDGDIGRHREHHHLHHREPGDGEAQQQRARLAARLRLPPPGIVRAGAIADRDERPQQGGQARPRRIPDDARAPRRVVDAGRHHARLAREPGLDEPDARAAMDAFDDERDFARAVLARAHDPRLRRDLVPVRPLVARVALDRRRRVVRRCDARRSRRGRRRGSSARRQGSRRSRTRAKRRPIRHASACATGSAGRSGSSARLGDRRRRALAIGGARVRTAASTASRETGIRENLRRGHFAVNRILVHRARQLPLPVDQDQSCASACRRRGPRAELFPAISCRAARAERVTPESRPAPCSGGSPAVAWPGHRPSRDASGSGCPTRSARRGFQRCS